MDLLKLPETWRDVAEFKYNYSTFKRDTEVRDLLNRIFDASLVAVYTNKKHNISKGSLDWSGDQIITISKSGKVAWLTNSEWAYFMHMK